MATILDGKIIKEGRIKELSEAVSKLQRKPQLVIIQIDRRQDSTAYINQKKSFGRLIGIEVKHISFDGSVAEIEVLEKIEALNADNEVDGIIVQMPIPDHLDKNVVRNRISPEKDVDGLCDVNVQKLQNNDVSGFIPATAKGIVSMLDYYRIPVIGKNVAVLGRSALAGGPTAQLLKNRGAHVTVCHSKTVNTKEITTAADIIVIAIGKPRFLTREYVSPGQTIIDVGINISQKFIERKLEEEVGGIQLVGDADFDSVKDVVDAISPVPGGVGQMTVLSLFENVLKASEKR